MPEVKVEHVQPPNGTVGIRVREDWTGQPPKKVFTVNLTGGKASHGEQFLTEERCRTFLSDVEIALSAAGVAFYVQHVGE